MRAPCLESLELRLLLSTLGPGQTAIVDVGGVLVNNGPVPVDYNVVDGALTVTLTADGAKFITNLPADVSGGFLLAAAKVGVAVRYRNVLYRAVAGDTTATVSAINRFDVGVGDLDATTLTGGIGAILLGDGDLDAVSSAAAIGEIRAKGDILGTVSALGDIGLVSAGRIVGSVASSGRITKLAVDEVTGSVQAAGIGDLLAGAITGGAVTVTGNVDRLWADTITGAADIDVYGSVQLLRAKTISAGENAGLWITIDGNLAKFQVGLIDGGQAVGDWAMAATTLEVDGSIGIFDAGLITGGTAEGQGSQAFVQFYVGTYLDNGTVDGGDIGSLRAAAITGGESSGGGNTWVMFDIRHDLVDARVGQIVGSATDTPGTASSVQFYVANDVCHLAAGLISGGTAVSQFDESGNLLYSGAAYVAIFAFNDIQELTAVRIDGGTAVGEEADAEVLISASNDIDFIRVNEITGGDGGIVTIDAGNDIVSMVVNRIVLTADGEISIQAGGDITLDVKHVRNWDLVGADGLQITAGGVVTDVRGTLTEFIDEVVVSDPV